jgi:hypothetical protein
MKNAYSPGSRFKLRSRYGNRIDPMTGKPKLPADHDLERPQGRLSPLRRLEWWSTPGLTTALLRAVVLLVALTVSAKTVSSQQAQHFAQDLDERSAVVHKQVEVAELTGKSAAECSVRLRGFIRIGRRAHWGALGISNRGFV